jgi:hypothetical protein
MEKIFAPEESRELLREWLIHARKSWKKHEEAARQLESWYRKIGVASVILSAIVGTSLFASLASLETTYEPWIRVIAGIVSISASVLASLITFYRYEERTERHRVAGISHKVALRRLEKKYTGLNSTTLDEESINRLQEELDELEKSAPVVPKDINRAVEKCYQDYIFVTKATDLRPGQEGR